MLRSAWRVVRNFLITSFVADIICFVWKQAEVYMYGTVQYREVDDFIMIIITAIVYLAVSSAMKD